MKLLIRWAISALSLFCAAWIVPGIQVDDGRGWVVYAIMAVVLGLANALIRPLLKLLTCPLILLTLGLFTLVINALTLLISSTVAVNFLHVNFVVVDFWSAFWGAIIVSVVSVVLNAIVRDENEDRKRKQRN